MAEGDKMSRDEAIAQALDYVKTAAAAWTEAVPREIAAFERSKTGEQLARLEHAIALGSLVSAHYHTRQAKAQLERALALPNEGEKS